MYVVYDNKKPAVMLKDPKSIWKNNKFATLAEAIMYANDWLGQCGPFKPTNDRDYAWIMDYSGYGDILEIRIEK